MEDKYKLLPGQPHPLGATVFPDGVNFAIFCEHGEKVELCLFSNELPAAEEIIIQLQERTDHTWHGFVKGLKPGQCYGFRIHGPYDPAQGHRFNPNKLLMDPYAKAIAGNIEWHDHLFGYEMGHEQKDLSFSTHNSAPYVPKSVVVDDGFDWEGDRPPGTPYHKTVIYEMHVKGFSQLHPEIPENIRGSFAAIATPAAISYLKELGVTAVELLPVQQFVADRHLVEKGLTNYWGYNTIGFFSPEAAYASSGLKGEQVTEFKEMVKALHKEGIEVILDVVFNHTGEGNHMGPTLCFRGIDNSAYYRLDDDKRYNVDYTGTGNTLNAYQPHVLRLIMDSLRYWVREMHVDGFRFDLAATLARELKDVNALSGFFDIIYQDPVIGNVKLIAEPWDLGEDGYMVGQFPSGWAEWNDKYRDCMRDFWRGEPRKIAEFGTRFTGSADIYRNDYRSPTASINLVTAHDGFTLKDLVSYNEKHNEANKDDNTDGSDENRSWNCGAEGDTEDEAVNSLRRQLQRNFLATLLLSQGVPMLLSGDELGNTQFGNNNAYCQDNELSWLKWDNMDADLHTFVKKLIQLRKNHPVFSRRGWFKGWEFDADKTDDIAWFQPTGESMQDEYWREEQAQSLMVFLDGNGIDLPDEEGNKVSDKNFLLCFHAGAEEKAFRTPDEKFGKDWKEELRTAPLHENSNEIIKAGSDIVLPPRSVIVFSCDPV